MDIRARSLVIEDDPSWQQILGEILADMGLEVEFASTSQEAIDKVCQQTYKFAIIDLSLGGTDHRNQDGLIVAEQLKSHNPLCSIIFLTGFATVELAVKVMRDLNAVTCLRKEVFRRSDFRKLITQVLNQAPIISDSACDLSDQKNQDDPRTESDEENYFDQVALVVEDDAGWRSLFTELLEETGYQVMISSSFVEAIALIKREKPILAVVDLSLASSLTQDNLDGYRLLSVAKKAGIPVIVVSGYIDPDRIEQAYADGTIVTCLEKRSFDRKSFEQAVATARSLPDDEDGVINTLTDREREVLLLLAEGMTNKEIASKLTITANTVKRHLKSLFVKLNVSTRSAASVRAIKLKLNKK